MPYGTISAAAAAAVPGDTIQLGYGTFFITAMIDLKQGVILLGQGPHLTILDGAAMDRLIRRVPGSAAPAEVRMLTLANANVGADANGGLLDLINVVLRQNNVGLLVPAGSTSLALQVTCYQNTLVGVQAAGAATVRNCLVLQNGTGLLQDPGGAFTNTYCNVFSNTNDYNGPTAGTGSIAVAIVFLDAATGDFRVPAGEPSINAGDPADPFALEPAYNGGRANMGAYGNTIWAATSPAPPAAGGGGGGGGVCGMVGLDAVLFLTIVAWMRRRRYNLRKAE